MKRAFAVILILVVLALAAPVKTLTAAALPAESAGLSVDAECVYPGMDKSIADGFAPFIKRNEARFILPVAGAAVGTAYEGEEGGGNGECGENEDEHGRGEVFGEEGGEEV